MLQLSTAPQLPKGQINNDAERRSGHDRRKGGGVVVASREGRSTDLTKTSVPLPFMLTIIGLVLAIAAGVWRIDARVSVIDARLDAREKYDADLKQANEKYLDQLAETLKGQIEIAGLRNSLLVNLQEQGKGQPVKR